jgi:hypothetical protein
MIMRSKSKRLVWHEFDRPRSKDGKMWQSGSSNWIRCQVWFEPIADKWAWRVQAGGRRGISWQHVAPSEDEAISAAEECLHELLRNALKGFKP